MQQVRSMYKKVAQRGDKEVEVYVQEISYYCLFFDRREDDGGKNQIRRLCEASGKMAG